MSVLANNTHASQDVPLYMSARPSTIDLSGAILSISPSDRLAVNGVELSGPEDWYLYPTQNNIVAFDNGPLLESIIDKGQATLYFNGDPLAYTNQIPSLEDWSQYPAASNVDMAGYSLNNTSSIQVLSSMNVGAMSVAAGPNTTTFDNISSVVFNSGVSFNGPVSGLPGVSTSGSGVFISSLATVNLSTGFSLMSSLQFSPSAGGFTFNLGLGGIVGEVANYAKGALTALAVSGGIAGATSLATGIYGMVNSRQTNYIYPPASGIVETVNGTSQLQVSTLGSPQTSYFRQVSSTGVSTSVELITSTIVNGLAVRTIGDPYQMPSTGTSSFIQAFGQWTAVPDPANWSLYPAISTIAMGSNQISFTTGGISRAIREGAGFQNNATVKSVEFYTPGAGTDATAARSASYIFTKFPAGQPADYTGDTLLYALNIQNPARLQTNSQYGTQTIAYLSDVGVRPSFDIYVEPNGSDTTGDGSFQKPFATISAALTYRATLSLTDEITINIGSGIYTENITVASANTYLTGITTGEARHPTNITGNVSITGGQNQGLSNFDITGLLLVNTSGNVGLFNVNLTAAASGFAYQQTAGTVIMTQCRITATNSSAISHSVGSLTIRDCVITTAIASSIIVAGSNITINNTKIQSSYAGTAAGALVRVNNAASVEILFSQLKYTIGTTDVGGNKCCVQFNNTTTTDATIAQCVFDCQGAITGTPNIQCIQRINTGIVLLSYGDIQAVGNAHNIAPAITKTSMTQVP